MNRFYDTLQFQKFAKVSANTIYKWQKIGMLPKRNLGRALYFLDEDIQKVPLIKKMRNKRMVEAHKAKA